MSLNMIAHILTLTFVVVVGFFLIVRDKTPFLVRLYALAVIVLALYLLVQKTTYLPFLGRAAFPSTVLKDAFVPDNANTSFTLGFPKSEEGKRVIYWGALPSSSVRPSPWDAYQNFENAGVAVIQDGKAVLKFHCPAKYKVPWRATLDRHIHYRVCCDSGMIGPAETVYVNC